MPLYEYRCQSCGRTTEALQKMSDPPLTVCEHCGGELKRLVSAPAVQFKGTGWYVTDYAKKSDGGGRSGGGSADKDKDKGAANDGGSAEKPAAAASTESKPAAEAKPAAPASSGGSDS